MDRQKLGDKMYVGKHLKGSTAKLPQRKSQFVAPLKQNLGEDLLSNQFHPELDDSAYHRRPKGIELFHDNVPSRNGSEREGFTRFRNRVSYNLDLKSKKEVSDLKAKLQNELMSVRNLMRRIEHYDGVNMQGDSGAHVGKLKRVHSVVDSVDGPESRPVEPRTMSGGMNRGVVSGKFGKGVSKKNVDAVLSLEKAPLSVKTKKTKANGRKNGEEVDSMFRNGNVPSKVFKSCSLLLNKLMKSKVAWVFNKPVDVKCLGLHDYHTIIKNPMDLGTIKTRLSTKWYKAPDEFADDVRLTFQNAMTYNMEGHNVNTFAKQLLKIFEDGWRNIEGEHLCQSFTAVDSEVHLPIQVPTSAPTRSPWTTRSLPPPLTTRSLPPPLTAQPLPPHTDIAMEVDILEAVTNTASSEAKSTRGFAHLPKPKVKDLQKREMTLDEKRKLSFDLEHLPSDKIGGVLRVIKKRNPSLCQNDDEIEVDIGTVDTETLWELDRFVISCKKAPSNIRRGFDEPPVGVVIEPNLHEKNQADSGIQEAKENEAEETNNFLSSSNEREKEGGRNTSVSNVSSSSSSGSGSSSSDSDTDSSSS